jgi:hypothetical protein
MDADDILLDFPTGTVVTPELVARRIAALSGATVLPNAGGPIGPEEPRLVYAEEAELARLRSENAAYYAKSFADAGAIADLTAEVSRLSGEVERLTGELAATDEMLGDAVKLCLSAKRERDEARGAADRMRADADRLDWIEARGVESIYLRGGSQFNPASQSLRSAIDAARGASRSAGAGTTGEG